MAKKKVVYFCKNCNYESLKWLGKCPVCAEWNTFEEKKQTNYIQSAASSSSEPVPIYQIKFTEEGRFSSGSKELDRVLGGGVVSGSANLIAGSPGIGKSTLLLQISNNVSRLVGTVLYISGEESLAQIKLRAERLNIKSEYLLLSTETEVQHICGQINDIRPSLVVIDSIQTIFDSTMDNQPGSVSQVRKCCSYLMELAKKEDIPVFLVGHITKGGSIAGPKILEHMVDVVLYFEGDNYQVYRILRGSKNRFGPTDEIGVFEMKGSGLEDVPNPSSIFLSERSQDIVGSQVVASFKGSRPIFLEIQSLVSESAYSNPRRLANGIDINRLFLMLAILEKKAGLHLHKEDAYTNIAGGLRVEEPAVDLGLCISLASSFKNNSLSKGTFVFGEVGLAGEVRSVSQPEPRLKEGVKLGFKRCILPAQLKEKFEGIENLELIGVHYIAEALEAALGG